MGLNSAAWVLQVAWRYFFTRRTRHANISSLLSVGGIVVGVMTLTTVLAVMNGFQLGTIRNLLEVGTFHVRMTMLTYTPQIDEELQNIEDVRAVVPFREYQSLVQGRLQSTRGAIFRAVPPDILERDSTLMEQLSIRSGKFDLSPGSVVIGERFAQLLGVSVGDTITIITDIAGFRGNAPTFVVRGTFHTGFLEYDRALGFVALKHAELVLGEDVPFEWGIKLENQYADEQMVSRLSSLFPSAVSRSWRQFNRAIFGALRLEKTMMTLLIGLIFVVVAFNIYQSLRRAVVERTEEIALVKAMGSTPRRVQMVFALQGVIIGLLGSTIGILLGLILSYNIGAVFRCAELVINGILKIMTIGISFFAPHSTITLPLFSADYFYIDEIPSAIFAGECAAIFLWGIGVSLLASIVASRKISHIRPAEALRLE